MARREDGDATGTNTGPCLLSSHGRVLLALAHDPDLRRSDLASSSGVTERTLDSVLADLEHAGLLERERVGRCNLYRLLIDEPLLLIAQHRRAVT
jgi:DNA-binding MarR family transcriptional regulator